MRTGFLPQTLKAVTVFAFLMGSPAFAKMTKEVPAAVPVSGKMSPTKDYVKQELDKKISQLKDNAKTVKGDALFKEISRMEADIKALRKDSPRQKEEDEIYIETVMLVLKEIPRPPKFKKAKCADYKIEILAGYDPQHEVSPSPGVSKGLEILDAVCK